VIVIAGGGGGVGVGVGVSGWGRGGDEDPLLLPLPDRTGEDGGGAVTGGGATESGTDCLHLAAVVEDGEELEFGMKWHSEKIVIAFKIIYYYCYFWKYILCSIICWHFYDNKYNFNKII